LFQNVIYFETNQFETNLNLGVFGASVASPYNGGATETLLRLDKLLAISITLALAFRVFIL
jgi:hypothetical protein